MIAAVAVCPHPPLLVPEIAAGAAGETAGLRAACDQAVRRLIATLPGRVVVIGAGTGGSFAATANPVAANANTRSAAPEHGGLRRFAPGVAGLDERALPLSLAIGSWLLDRAGAVAERQLVGVHADGRPTTDAPDVSGHTALLVMADGSARRSLKGPGYLDGRAAPFDAIVVKALAEADVVALADLDQDLCAELLVGGVGAWKALAALAAGTRWRAEVLYDDAPYGVQYTVASWLPA